MPNIIKQILVPIFISFAIAATAQKPAKDSIKILIAEIAKRNVYETSAFVGFAGSVSKQYQRYTSLKDLASEEDLLEIAAKNSNAVVRLYALKALRERKIMVPEPLLEQFEKDNTIVSTRHGCLANKVEVRKLVPSVNVLLPKS